MRRFLIFATAILCAALLNAQENSTAGFYPIPGSGRDVYNFNIGWRFCQGDITGAMDGSFDDSSWEVVNLPHTVELEPAEASGCRNYQGPAWYRKSVTLDDSFDGRRVFLHFEAIMGRSDIYVDGVKVKEHLGGYLPVIIDLQAAGVKPGKKALIAVRTDNSDDPSFPPGKDQNVLDFAYHGGIYRDSWLIAMSPVHVTDPNFEDKIAGGGVFIHSDNVSKSQATLFIDTDVRNDSKSAQSVTVTSSLEFDGEKVQSVSSRISLKAGESKKVTQKIIVRNPKLWTPETPYLYRVATELASKGKVVDGLETATGIRSIEFRGKDGFYLNGEPYGKLMGANRHQDFAYIGNAMPNNLSWRDAVLLRNAGCKIIRAAHYPQDPSFMDACDALGMFVIVPTPGWQFWNSDPEFAELIYNDIRNMVRRDRNHPSVIMWEPILNETDYPADFAQNTYNTVHAEYPYPGCFCAADYGSDGVKDLYDVVYGSPASGQASEIPQSTFTREWGDFVDNWEAHNSLSRASRSWGEIPMLIQAEHYANAHRCNDYDYLYGSERQHVGGAIWHPFDHQRGYHPDPFWGGILDAFRQPKYSYYMFKSQVPADYSHISPLVETGPMVYIAHESTPFSPADVTVYTNCDAVRLILNKRDTLYQEVNRKDYAMPSAPVVFKDAYRFTDVRMLNGDDDFYSMVAEGIVDGKVVTIAQTKPSAKSSKIVLEVDDQGIPFTANGSDIVTVIAYVTDEWGEVRHLAKENIVFEVEGEGELIGDETIGANPRAVEFGTAPALIRATMNAGRITVKARVQHEGTMAPVAGEITFESTPSEQKFMYSEVPSVGQGKKAKTSARSSISLTEDQKKELLRKVGADQDAFGEFAGQPRL